MGRDNEVVARGGLEALEASPGGILDLKNGAIRDENHVEKTVRNNDILCALNYAWEDGKSRGKGAVTVGEDVDVRALIPFDTGGVNGFLDVRSIEIDCFRLD